MVRLPTDLYRIANKYAQNTELYRIVTSIPRIECIYIGYNKEYTKYPNVDTLILTHSHVGEFPGRIVSIIYYKPYRAYYKLPEKLKRFSWQGSCIDILDFIPQSVTQISGIDSDVHSIQLPSKLELLKLQNCWNISTLPDMPPMVHTLICCGCVLTKLPRLSLNLRVLNIAHTPVTSIPNLPNSLVELDISSTEIMTLPDLSNTRLVVLDCFNSFLASLPKLPSTILHVRCSNTHIRTLPDLPDTLLTLCFTNMVPMLHNIDKLPSCLTTISYNTDLVNITCPIPINCVKKW